MIHLKYQVSVLEGSLILIGVKWRKGGQLDCNEWKKRDRDVNAENDYTTLSLPPVLVCAHYLCLRDAHEIMFLTAGLHKAFELCSVWGVALEAQVRQRFAQTDYPRGKKKVPRRFKAVANKTLHHVWSTFQNL